MSPRQTYRCPVCATQLQIPRDSELLVLLQSGDGRVEQVVTSDDVEIHRCRYLPDVQKRVRVA
jgi:hypothetical protein